MKGLDYSELLKKYDLKATPQRVIFLKELEIGGHLNGKINKDFDVKKIDIVIKGICPDCKDVLNLKLCH